MQELTDNQIRRQDFVDNAIFEMLNDLNPTNQRIIWNIEIIARIRDEVERYFVEKNICKDWEFYPYTEDEDGD